MNGNLGIGTNSPSARLYVIGSGNLTDDLSVGRNATVGNILSVAGSGSFGSSLSANSLSVTGNLTAGNTTLGTLNAASLTTTGNLAARGNATITGNVGIGTTAPDQLLTVNGNASKSVGGGSWATFSDERLKNINGRFTRGLTDLMLLNPIIFEYKPDNALGLHSTGATVGFSAQEVQKIIPEAVSTSESSYLQINNDPILWTMLNAVKEQNAQILKQRRQIDELKQIVCELKPEAAICKEQR